MLSLTKGVQVAKNGPIGSGGPVMLNWGSLSGIHSRSQLEGET